MDLIKKVDLKPADFKKYQSLTPEKYEDCLALSKKLKGKRVLHLNSTQLGGGVSELLHSQVPLENSLGLNSAWHIINAPIKFFQTTKKIHNLLQGEKGSLSEKEKSLYLNWLRKEIAPSFKKLLEKEKPEIVVIHDPQPLPLVSQIPEKTISVLRMHIDLSEPNPQILNFLKPLILKYRQVILSHSQYRPDWLKAQIIMPAINPFTAKNRTMKKEEAESILKLFNINTERPAISQISRFDPWKDPLGVIRAYQIAKREIPDLQLILSGIFLAKDDPQAKEMFEEVKKQAQDPDIFLFANPKRLKEINSNLLINAIYTASQVVLQKSLKEGFGLTVTEAMWKGKPVIGGNASGIALQIKNGVNGFLVNSPQEAADCLIKLLKDENLRKKIGGAARQSVKENFLMSRFILDHLRLYNEIC